MSQTWKDYKTEAIADYQNGMSVAEIAKKYNNNIPNVIAGLQRAGVYRYVNTRWTADEITILKEKYPVASWDELLQLLPRYQKDQITQKASSLKIKRDASFWSQEDVNTLKDAYSQEIPVTQIVELLHGKYSPEAIYTKASKLKIKQREFWSDEDKELLRKHYENTPTDELMKMFPGKKLVNVQMRARSMGLYSYTYLSRQWTSEDDKFIETHWLTMTDKEMASELGRTFRSVKWRREKLGLMREISPAVYEYLRKFLWKENRRWRIESIKACGYKCIVTGGRFTDVHHLYGSNLIVQETLDELGLEYDKVESYTDEELQLIAEKYAEINLKYPLGVCLSQEVHMQFHNEYGYGNNRPEQFLEFLNNHYPNVHLPVTITAA